MNKDHIQHIMLFYGKEIIFWFPWSST